MGGRVRRGVRPVSEDAVQVSALHRRIGCGLLRGVPQVRQSVQDCEIRKDKTMKYKQIKLTPELAKEWLATMPEYQRSVSTLVVAEYAKDMAEGRWVEGTGDAIRFNKQGQMIDGQHRCLAVVESGTTIVVTVIEGLDDEVYLVLDKGRKRTAADTIGGKNANVRAAIAKSLIALASGTPVASIVGGNASKKNNPISATEAAEVAMTNEATVSQILECYVQLKSANNGRFSAPVATCLVAYAAELTGNMESFNKFCDDLIKPVQDRSVVCTMAREKASSFILSKGKSKNAMIFAIYAIAFRSWVSGNTPKIIQTSNITKDINSTPLKRDWNL